MSDKCPHLDAELVLQRDGQAVERADSLAILGEVVIKILGPLECHIGEEFVKAIGLSRQLDSCSMRVHLLGPT